MTDSKISEIQAILIEVDAILRERLNALGVNISHVILAIGPDGAGVLRSNVGQAGLGDMAEMLAEVYEDATTERPENEPLH